MYTGVFYFRVNLIAAICRNTKSDENGLKRSTRLGLSNFEKIARNF